MTKKVVVIGTGYVGLPLAIMLARSGYQVMGVDVQDSVVNSINKGALLPAEDEVRQVFEEPEVRKNLRASKTPAPADVFIICVPTPLDAKKQAADLSLVRQGAESIVPCLQAGNLVILESTVPPGTCRNVLTPIIEKTGLKAGKDIFLAHCPERILPGAVLKEIVENDRVIGGVNRESTRMAKEIYASFVKGNLYETDIITAELVKLMENTFRDVNIALANEFAAVAAGLGIDILPAIELANKHPRVNILKPGIGVGGHCIPIVPWFIKQVDPVNSRLITAARKVNDEVPGKMAAEIKKAVKDIQKPRIVALGITYKPDTYDTRNSPAQEIIDLLKVDGYQVSVYDPVVNGRQYESIESIVKGADCLVVLVEHKAVREEIVAKETRIKKAMRHPLIIRFYQ
ncbi:MAG: nucleotide sugar dehydrogenase [Dehalococcoidales bacterium]